MESKIGSKVYVVQDVARLRGLDLSDAARYGELTSLLKERDNAHNAHQTVWTLKNKLAHYCDDDYLLAMGDPVLIMLAGIIAAQNNRGVVNVLKWDNKEHRYYPINVRI